MSLLDFNKKDWNHVLDHVLSEDTKKKIIADIKRTRKEQKTWEKKSKIISCWDCAMIERKLEE